MLSIRARRQGEVTGQVATARQLPAILLSCILILIGSGVTAAQPADDCHAVGDSALQVCEPFLGFWEANGGMDVLGAPLTGAYDEVSADTLDPTRVQYFERGRLEYDPARAGTPYEVVLGRVGADVLHYEQQVQWQSLPGGDPNADHYFVETGHAVASEFWRYFSSNGVDLGDAGVSFRETLAMFGFPITEPTMEAKADGESVLTQWFERGRVELTADGEVVMADLGTMMTENPDGFSARIRRELDANLEFWHLQLGETGFLAGLWVPGVGSWTGSIGEANHETGEPMAFDQHVRIGSITKEFTVTMILQLADDGLLSLDDPIGEFVDGIPNGDRITLRQLANMTSGLANYTFDPDFQDKLFSDPEYEWTPEEIIEIGVRNTEAGCPHAPSACFEPGEGWTYSNTNTVLLGMVVEVVTGQRYQDVLEQRILDPLGMDNTLHPTSGDLPEPYAHGYTTQGLPDGQDGLRDASTWNPSYLWGVGHLVSNFEDLRTWARAVGSGELLSPEMQAERMTTVKLPPNTDERAYAVGIGYSYGWWGHGGELPGYNTNAYYQPELDAVLVVIANADQVHYDGGYEDPAYLMTDSIVAIGNREADIGDYALDVPWGEVIPAE